MSENKTINFEYDPANDLATIAGVEWSGELLRAMREWTHQPRNIPPLGYIVRIVAAPGALPYGVRFERVPSFDRLVEAAEAVYQNRGELFDDPNSEHRRIRKLGMILNEVRRLSAPKITNSEDESQADSEREHRERRPHSRLD